ncbi:MAG: serine/threonine protein kinase, partial [Pseudobdellovibrionaceae bacterium]
MGRDDQTQLVNSQASPVVTFGKYILLKKLAVGGMAEVFLARPASSDGNGRVQVVKRILPHVADNAVFLEMFRSEIQVIMGFNHPHTVQLHDFGECARQPFIAMEYIEGKSLKEILNKFIQQKEKIPVPMALGLMAQAAAGLSYAHTFVNKVTDEAVHAIHRDISPHNLMVTYEGNLKVIDFGIAKATIGMREATRVGTIKGKMAYLSPEQVSGQPVDARTDVFALGIVAWELLTMKRAFIMDGDSEVTVVSRIENCESYLAPPSALNKEIPVEVDEVILKALKKDPIDRYATAKDFQVALRKVMQAFYPNYSYADTGARLSSVFAIEMQMERKELRDLNVLAQMELVTRSAGVPGFVPERTHGLVPASRLAGGAATSSRQDPVNDRLIKIEAMMKQNASTKHYVWLAMYLIAAIAIRMEGRYSIFNYLIPIPEVNMSSIDPVKVPHAAAARPINAAVHPIQVPAAPPVAPAAGQAQKNETISVSSVTPAKPIQVRPTQIHAAQLLIKAVNTKTNVQPVANPNQMQPRRLLSSADAGGSRGGGMAGDAMRPSKPPRVTTQRQPASARPAA